MAGLGLVGTTESAGAHPPEREEFPFSVRFVDDEICAFPIEFSFEGTIKITRYFDENGNLIRVHALASDNASATNLDTGTSATGHEVSSVWFDMDGSETISGLPIHLNTPGHGAVLIDAGRLELDSSGTPTFIAGPHQGLEGDYGELCIALSG
jgi:hypothetical protein